MTKFVLSEIKTSPAVNYSNFLSSLDEVQLQIVDDLEKIYQPDSYRAQESAAQIARELLNVYPWPNKYSSSRLDYATFDIDYSAGVTGDSAFYYYIFDKCIPRGKRNRDLNFMDRILTLSKASKREHFEVNTKWILKAPTGDINATLAFDPASGDHRVLLPKSGERAPDFKMMFIYNGIAHVWGVEEKPCLSVTSAIDYYSVGSEHHKDLHGTDKLMLALEKSSNGYEAGYYLHDYKTGITMRMIPAPQNNAST
jgi:hypothetical protein